MSRVKKILAKLISSKAVICSIARIMDRSWTCDQSRRREVILITNQRIEDRNPEKIAWPKR
jgi:hypothetical protein